MWEGENYHEQGLSLLLICIQNGNHWPFKLNLIQFSTAHHQGMMKDTAVVTFSPNLWVSTPALSGRMAKGHK